MIIHGTQDGKMFQGKEIEKVDESRSSCPDLCGNVVKQQKKNDLIFTALRRSHLW